MGRQAQPAPKGPNDKQVSALLREAGRDYALVRVLLQTGIRIGECASLDHEDITFGERSGSVLIHGGAGNKARSVRLNASARQAVAAVTRAWPRRPRGVAPTPCGAARRAAG